MLSGVHSILIIVPRDAMAVRGQEAKFTCSSDKRDAITWRYDGQATESIMVGRVVKNKFIQKYEMTRNEEITVFTVKNVSLSDSGNYTCVDELGLGEEASAELIVLGELAYNYSIYRH